MLITEMMSFAKEKALTHEVATCEDKRASLRSISLVIKFRDK
jgi:hypothetical protein